MRCTRSWWLWRERGNALILRSELAEIGMCAGAHRSSVVVATVCVAWERDSLASEGLHEDLHAIMETKDEAQSMPNTNHAS
jgi:hypothetical protein